MWHAWHCLVLGSWFLRSVWHDRHCAGVGEAATCGSWHALHFSLCLGTEWSFFAGTSEWHDAHVGTANLCGSWQFLQTPWTAPRCFTLSTFAEWHSLHRAHHAGPLPGGAWCGGWHCMHLCLPPAALAVSCAWQESHVFLSRTSCCAWQPVQLFACADSAGHLVAVAALASWHDAQLARAAAAGWCGAWHERQAACFSLGGWNPAATALWQSRHAVFATPGGPCSAWHVLHSP